MATKKSASAGEQIICVNRQARHNCFIDEVFEAGLVLVGSEVKSLRDGKANLVDSYARIHKGEAFLVNSHISAYPGANQFNHVLIRRNLITMLMGIELMLNAVNINFVAFNHYLFPHRLEGHFFALIVMAIAAAEAAIAIALIINIYRQFATVSVDDVDELKY